MTGPGPATLAWVASLVGPGARVVESVRLPGGLAADVHAVTIVDGSDRRTDLVVRQLRPGHGDEPARTESLAAVLTALADHDGVPSPRLVDADPHGGSNDGRSTLVMERLPGSVVLAPQGLEAGIEEMARVLVAVHATPVDAPPFESWFRPDRAAPPSGAHHRARWRAALDLVLADPPPAGERTFLHRDHQPFNLLWEGPRISGLVDWDHACLGPTGVDVAHTRLNLAILASADAAERFREHYEQSSGSTVDPRWDLQELLGYGDGWKESIPVQVAGRAPLDVAGMTARVEDLLGRVLDRC